MAFLETVPANYFKEINLLPGGDRGFESSPKPLIILASGFGDSKKPRLSSEYFTSASR